LNEFSSNNETSVVHLLIFNTTRRNEVPNFFCSFDYAEEFDNIF
jgi:hypothetical protein